MPDIPRHAVKEGQATEVGATYLKMKALNGSKSCAKIIPRRQARKGLHVNDGKLPCNAVSANSELYLAKVKGNEHRGMQCYRVED